MATAESAARVLNGTSPVAQRILAHARLCFERAGMRETTIEDIAAAAGVARQTVYSHFKRKQDIVDSITLQEAIKARDDLLRRIEHWPRLADKMTEGVATYVLMARENPYLARLIHIGKASPRLGAAEVIYEWRRERWKEIINAGRASGELAADLDIDNVVLWVSSCQCQMITRMKLDQTALSEAELRKLVRRFVVSPLLSARDAADPIIQELTKLHHQIAVFSEIAAEQAAEITALKGSNSMSTDE